MPAVPKEIKKQLREWCSIAYRRKLDAELKKLHDSFRDWEQGKLNCFDLSEIIHQFHDNTARDLYSTYVMLGDHWIQLRGVSRNESR